MLCVPEGGWSLHLRDLLVQQPLGAGLCSCWVLFQSQLWQMLTPNLLMECLPPL